MDDITPRLHGGQSATIPTYAPLSGLAVAALGASLLYSLLLALLAFWAFGKKLPLVELWLLGIAGLGILLSFSARRRIANSEGTQKGTQYANAAWWICVIGGAGYLTYFVTIEWTVRKDAEEAFGYWAGQMIRADPGDANDEAFARAVHLLLPPNERVAVEDEQGNPLIANQIARFASTPVYTSLRHSDLFPFLRRNTGRSELIPQGLRNWKAGTDKLECDLSVLFRTPEGEFPISVPMQALVETRTGRRVWQILRPDGYLQPSSLTGVPRLTRYGWLVKRIEETAANTAIDFLPTPYEQGRASASGRLFRQPFYSQADSYNRQLAMRLFADSQIGQRVSYQAFVTNSFPRTVAEKILDSTSARTAAIGGTGAFWAGDPNYDKQLDGNFFTDLNGQPSSPADRLKLRFAFEHVIEGRIRLAMPGGTPGFPDRHPEIQITANSVEVRFPLEIRPPESQDTTDIATGRLVLVPVDAAALLQFAQQQQANPAVVDSRPEDIATFPITWRVVRIGSDLKVVSYRPSGPGGM